MSERELKEFRKIWRKEYDRWISKEKARDYAERLLQLYAELEEISRDQHERGEIEIGSTEI